MDDFVLLSAVAGIFGVGLVCLAWYISIIRNELQTSNVEKTGFLSLSEDFKQELYDLMQMALEDTVGNIQPPTAFDHLAGFGVQFLQNKMMGGMGPLFNDGLPSLAHGEEEIQTEETH